MPKPTDAGENAKRRQHFHDLAATCGEYTRETYAWLLASSTGEIPAFALLYERARSSELVLSTTIDFLAGIAQDELERDPSYCPKALVFLDSGEQRTARMPVFFMAATMQLPALVGDIVSNDLVSRQGDDARNPKREAELERASDLIHSGKPLPEELYDVVADVIEDDLADREGDLTRAARDERLLSTILDQLLGRTPPTIPAGA